MLIADRYELGETLGEGGMGSVLSAVDVKTGRTVAVKLMRKHLVADEGAVRRFEREMHAMMLIEHPNTVRLYDFGRTAKDELYLVMELVSGCTLDEELRAIGAFAIERVVRIGHHIARALAAVHAHGIVHRDLKPQNIMLRDLHGEPDWVLVLDFGIATLHNASRVTETGLVAGSPAYCSPEQARGEVPGPKSDLYMLGVVLYEMTSGRLPFEASTVFGLLTAHVNLTPEPVDSFRPDAPRWLALLIAELLEKDPNKRPADAATVLHRLTDRGGVAPLQTRKHRHADAFAQTDVIRGGGTFIPATTMTTRPTRRWSIVVLGLSLSALAATIAVTSQMTSPREQLAGGAGDIVVAEARMQDEVANAEPSEMHTPETIAAAVDTTPRSDTTTTPIEVLTPAPSDAPVTAPAGPVQPGAASVQITSQPSGATLLIDGVEVGVTPWPLVSHIGAKHHLELRIAGHPAQLRDIIVTTDRMTNSVAFPAPRRNPWPPGEARPNTQSRPATTPVNNALPAPPEKAPQRSVVPSPAVAPTPPPKKIELIPKFMDGD